MVHTERRRMESQQGLSAQEIRIVGCMTNTAFNLKLVDELTDSQQHHWHSKPYPTVAGMHGIHEPSVGVVINLIDV